MHRSAISHARLMRESTDRIERALGSDDDKEHLVARRVSENARTWELWENEHSGLMHQVADYGVLRAQAAGVELPVAQSVADLLSGALPLGEAVIRLMSRRLKTE